MIFKDKITDYVGTADGYTDAQSQRFIVDGCYDVFKKIRGIKGYDETLKFGKWADATSPTVNIDDVREIVFVKRKGIQAKLVTPALAHKYTDAGSIHYASSGDPIFYLIDTTMNILPVPVSGEDNKYLYLPEFAILNYDSGTSKIVNFPSEYYEHMLTYATIKILEQLYQSYISDEEDAELAQVISGRLDRAKLTYNEFYGVAQGVAQ